MRDKPRDIPDGLMIDRHGNLIPKPLRPRTLGEAKRFIAKAFEHNHWDEAGQIRFMTRIGVQKPGPLNGLSAEDTRIVLDRMTENGMILFRD